MADKKKNKTPSWDKIGAQIGKKIETECKDKKPWDKASCLTEHKGCGGFGRLIFAIGVLTAMHYAGWLTVIPIWVIIMIGLGFALMKL